MLIRPPQFQFFKNEIKITVTDAVIIKRKLQMLNIKHFFQHFIQNVIIIITNKCLSAFLKEKGKELTMWVFKVL